MPIDIIVDSKLSYKRNLILAEPSLPGEVKLLDEPAKRRILEFCRNFHTDARLRNQPFCVQRRILGKCCALPDTCKLNRLVIFEVSKPTQKDLIPRHRVFRSFNITSFQRYR